MYIFCINIYILEVRPCFSGPIILENLRGVKSCCNFKTRFFKAKRMGWIHYSSAQCGIGSIVYCVEQLKSDQ